ncbi:MAG: L-ribulose-5-phosphate 3-epimerase [Oscillospiraceae bacterium]|jgi:L-ribulose-5-phosphate 3-epimerase
METMMEYSLGLYEKAMPEGLGWPKMFEITKECGFDRLEISIDETDWRQARLDLSPAEQCEIGTLSRIMGTNIRTMCLSGHRRFPLGSHDEETRKRSMEIMRKAIRFCVNADIPIIQLAGYDVYYEKSDAETRKWFSENLKESADIAAENGVVLAFETMETPFMDTCRKAMKYVNMIGSPWLGVYPDIGNLENAAELYGHDVVDDLTEADGSIFAMHLKETKPGKYRDMNFGDGGHTEYERCIKAGLSMGVRLFTGEFWYHEGEDYLKNIKHANSFLRQKIEKASEGLSS